ncbi:MAG TPA: serine/threonine-protein kinase, partial [Polyangiaceae bacterium]|nr:serine/threonine-protein kinase [Polyangiaceae bacterium]
MRRGESWRSFRPGERVPGTDYLVEERLGEGGMGVVYAVRHLLTGEWRALKVLSPYVANRPELARRLVLEGQVLSRLRSPHAVRVYEVGRLDDGRPYFVMDLLHGETLYDALARGPLPPARACGYVYQVLGALADLHRANLVHRDVKPANLFVRASDGVCVLLDVGLVKVLTEGGPFHPWRVTTGEGVALGTARYVPPEAGRGERPDARADVYAAGVVLAELLAGELALGELDETAYLWHRDVHGFPMPAGVPAELRRVIAWATQNDPAERLPSAARFAAELGWACQRAGIDLASARPVLPPPARPRRALGVVPRAFVGGLGAGVAAALAATWWLRAPAIERVSPEPRAAVRAASTARPAAVATTAPP